MRRPLAVALFVLGFASARRAEAEPAARFVYLRGKGTESCPAEADVRQAVVGRLGYDPFWSYATATMFAEVSAAEKSGFSASLKLVDADNAVRGDRLTGLRIRTDLSVTLFLSEPDEYDGGELVVEDNYGSHEVKLPAGDLVLYPASSLHLVTPVTRGRRVASFFWLQSMVRDAHARSLIFDLDTAIQSLVDRLGRDDPETVKLTGIYHNLIRYWAEI